jgi:hypothetical protein
MSTLATEWENNEPDKPCRKVAWWMDAATPDPDVLAKQAIQDCVAGLVTVDQAREKLNEILSQPRAGDTLSVLTPDQISALPKIPNACLLGDNVIQKGGSTVIAGPPGIGKTKLTLQLIVAKNTGRDWCSLVSHGPPIEWIYLQNENGRDRLERDLTALRKWAPDFDQSRLHIQVYQTDNDGFLCLDDPDTVARIERTIRKFPSAEGVVADPLRDFGVGNLDSDADMVATVRALAEIVRAGNPHRVLIPVHHALTGRAGAIKAFGLERSSFARNSKALLGWARAQINVSPGKEDSNEILLISCGKNNDGKEFPRVAVRLNPDSMVYEVDFDFDFEAWDEQLTATGKKKKQKFNVEMVKELVKFSGEKEIKPLAQLITDKIGCGRARAYELVHEARNARIFKFNKITETYAKI